VIRHAALYGRGRRVLGYAYSPRLLAHDPPPTTVDVAGRPFPLGTANVSDAVLTAQAHELVTRSALRGVLVALPLAPAPEDA
jgi:hypothetical protein